MLVMMKLKKHFGNNVAGEVCGFSPSTAEHIKKHQGGDVLAEFDERTQRFDPETGKVVSKTEAKSK